MEVKSKKPLKPQAKVKPKTPKIVKPKTTFLAKTGMAFALRHLQKLKAEKGSFQLQKSSVA